MFGHNDFVWTPVNVLQSETRIFKAETPNSIHATVNNRYVVTFSEPNYAFGSGLTLKSRGENTLTHAISTATSGQYSDSTTYCIGSYHPEDSSAALANASLSPSAFEDDGSFQGNGGCPIQFEFAEQCEDPNRETKEDGSCDSECKDGYEYDENNTCVEATDDDPNDCASKKRVKGTDNACGDCLSGFTENATSGVCEADEEEEEEETNWFMWGGIGALAVAAYFVMGKSS